MFPNDFFFFFNQKCLHVYKMFRNIFLNYTDKLILLTQVMQKFMKQTMKGCILFLFKNFVFVYIG